MVKNFQKGKIVACLDLGSSKLFCIIAQNNNDQVKILGYGHKKSKGIYGSAITDMRLAQKSIISVVAEAEKMAGFNIDRLLVSISANHCVSSNQEVTVGVVSDVVKNNDILNLASKVRSFYKKHNHEIIHLIPIQYIIDGTNPVTNPRYMSGKKLSAKFHVVSTPNTIIKNIENCLKRCQLSVDSYIVQPYSSALSCLSKNDIHLGSLMIDIGGSATSVAILTEGKLVYVNQAPIGGIQITKDISSVLNIDFSLAEQIKNLNSSIIISPMEEHEIVKLGDLDINFEEDNINITRIEFSQIIESRLEEIFESVKKVLTKSNIPLNMINNVVISGGSTEIVGIDKLASYILGKTVKIAYPNKINLSLPELIKPANCCSVGMLVFLKNLYSQEKIKNSFETKTSWFRKAIDKIAQI